MTRIERQLISYILEENSKLNQKELKHWLYTRNKEFDNISPFDFYQKLGGKKFKKKIQSIRWS